MTREAILVVDDEPGIRKLVSSTLGRAGYRVQGASDAAEARQRLLDDRYDVALLDVELPGDSGIDLLRDLATRAPELAAVMVSAHDDPMSTSSAVELGAFGYVVKPFRSSELLVAVDCAVRRQRLELDRKAERYELASTVHRSTQELRDALVRVQRLESELGLSHEEIVRCLAQCIDVRDGGTGAHLRRVSLISGDLGRRLGLDQERVRLLRQASALHDIGKIGIPDAILLKEGPLDVDERAMIEAHTSAGFEILEGSGSAMLDLAATIALTHHERVDGSGYPLGLAGDAIPLESRIVAVADMFDALTHDRPYRPARPVPDALETVIGLGGSAFDPCVVHALSDLLRENERASVGDAPAPACDAPLAPAQVSASTQFPTLVG